MDHVKTLKDGASILKKDIEYTEFEDVTVKEDLPHNDYVTNCYLCNKTCHFQCMVDDRTRCYCFHYDPDKGEWKRPPEDRNADTCNKCHVCGCPHTNHGNDFKIYRVERRTVRKTN